MSAVDAVLGRGYVDDRRLFVTGGSGGGVLTHGSSATPTGSARPWCQTGDQLDDFVLTGDLANYFYRYWFEGFPWDNMQSYWKRSPCLCGQCPHADHAHDRRSGLPDSVERGRAILRGAEIAQDRHGARPGPNASHDISARPSLLIDKVAYVLAWFKSHDAARESFPSVVCAVWPNRSSATPR